MKKVFIKAFLFMLIVIWMTHNGFSQQFIPDLWDTSRWIITGDAQYQQLENSIKLQAEDGGLMVLRDSQFTTGTIELDLKGENRPGECFLGIAFNIQGEEIYESIYFRPFNFRNGDRKTHAVQYIKAPDYHWFTLREKFPGKYESAIEPAPDPDEWFHAKIEVGEKFVKVFVNEEKIPSLVVDRIPMIKKGLLGLLIDYKSTGEFKNLIVRPNNGNNYGYNETVGEYFEVAPDTKLYYEIYGEGEPVLMLHGGVYGYIDEYEYFINELSRDFRVLCLATRGHVKSDIGHEPYTYNQRAEDAAKFLDHLSVDSCSVIGFSDGGFAAYRLAALFPERVKKMIVIGAGNRPNAGKDESNYTSEGLLSNSKDYFEGRLTAMPEPERWNESLQMLNDLYNHEVISHETFEKIQCPVLLLGGEYDEYSSPEKLFEAYQQIDQAHLSIIPGCGHVAFYCNWPAVWAAVEPFLRHE